MAIPKRDPGPSHSMASLSIASLIAASLVAIMAPTTVAAPASCRVRNVTQDTAGRSLIRMVEKAVDGDHLRVRGICPGEVVIDVDLVIDGTEGAVLTGRGTTRVVHVKRGVSAALRGVVITRGCCHRAGGGIANHGTLTLRDAVVRSNAGDFYDGGGIYNVGTARVLDSVVRDNASASSGGGIENRGLLTLRDSTVRRNATGNDGGGIRNRGTMNLRGSIVRGNAAPLGGGISNYGGTLIMTSSTVTGNTAGIEGGGLLNGPGTVTLDGASSVTGNTPDQCVGTPAC